MIFVILVYNFVKENIIKFILKNKCSKDIMEDKNINLLFVWIFLIVMDFSDILFGVFFYLNKNFFFFLYRILIELIFVNFFFKIIILE